MSDTKVSLTLTEKLLGISCILLTILACFLFFTREKELSKLVNERPNITSIKPIDYEEFNENLRKRLEKTVRERMAKAKAKHEEFKLKYKMKPGSDAPPTPMGVWELE